MDKLPAELVLHIAYCLDAFDIAKLHLVCRRLHEITRDKEFWKQRCFENSCSAAVQKRRDFQFIAPSLIQEHARLFEFQRRARALSSTSGLGNNTGASSDNGRSERSRAFAKWDPAYTNEKVDWYEEYLARHAPISMSWLQQPVDAQRHEHREIRGLGRYDRGDGPLMVAPLDDGTLTIWDIGKQDVTEHTKGGTIIARSRPRHFSTYKNDRSGSSFSFPPTHFGPNVVECLSVDQVRNKAYVAVLNDLDEVDLETLQISHQSRYPSLISALSVAAHPVPLTVATTNSLHLHDPRERSSAWRPEADQSVSVERNTAELPQLPRDKNGLQNDFPGGGHGTYAPLSQPGPLSITHLPSTSGEYGTSDGYICVAGRFPSILTYNRRMFPRIHSTIHSGSRLASMTSLPHPLLYSRSNPPSNPDTAHTLIACGEYNGKGSLELYPFSTSGQPSPPSSSSSYRPSVEVPLAPVIPYQNRTSASSSKILSVTPHGTRVVFSDGDGGLKWVERDGHSLVRRWNINTFTSSTMSPPPNPDTPGLVRNLFVNGTQEGDVARKILPVGPWEDSRGEIAVWTGERIGVLGFRPKPRFEWEWDEGDKEGKEEKLYAGRIRRALATQADGVRFVRGLGLDR
ncbi:MAG: hypothetical protein LQ343_005982 [Gyalolechia ehrenbergii]|nr:MAG: hypothetical protein LQ343_005982 [Gyalolechia ehrenbergii]